MVGLLPADDCLVDVGNGERRGMVKGQARHGDKNPGGSMGVEEDGRLTEIACVPSGPRVDGDGIGHKTEATPSRNEKWMVR